MTHTVLQVRGICGAALAFVPVENRSVAVTSRPDEAFQQLLLRFSAAAAQENDFHSLIAFFCRETRALFRVSGTYFWKLASDSTLVGVHAEGHMAEHFVGTRLGLGETAVVSRAVRERTTVYIDEIDRDTYSLAGKYGARSAMAVPLIVAGEIIGAVAFLECQECAYFNADVAAKATILAAQLATLIEAARLLRDSREEQRRLEALVQCAHSLQATLDRNAACGALAEHARALLGGRLAAVAVREGNLPRLRALAAEPRELVSDLIVRYRSEGSAWLDRLMTRAMDADGATWMTADPAGRDPVARLIGGTELLSSAVATA